MTYLNKLIKQKQEELEMNTLSPLVKATNAAKQVQRESIGIDEQIASTESLILAMESFNVLAIEYNKSRGKNEQYSLFTEHFVAQ